MFDDLFGQRLVLGRVGTGDPGADHRDGGQLAVKEKESAALKPINKSPKELLQGLMKAGAKVEVCALFLPNSDLKPTDLIEGVGVAKPADVAAYMLQANVKTVSY